MAIIPAPARQPAGPVAALMVMRSISGGVRSLYVARGFTPRGVQRADGRNVMYGTYVVTCTLVQFNRSCPTSDTAVRCMFSERIAKAQGVRGRRA